MIKIIKPSKKTKKDYFDKYGLIMKEIRMVDDKTFERLMNLRLNLESNNKPI